MDDLAFGFQISFRKIDWVRSECEKNRAARAHWKNNNFKMDFKGNFFIKSHHFESLRQANYGDFFLLTFPNVNFFDIYKCQLTNRSKKKYGPQPRNSIKINITV